MLSVENFGLWILSELEKRNWSQSDLVRASGISRGTLSNIISGTRGIGQDSLIAIAHALKISPITLFRKAGLLPDNNGADVKLDDWEFLLKQMSPEDEAELGVRTKNRKAALTYLLQIPELLTVLQAWQARLLSLPATALWYATLTRDGMTLTPTQHAFTGRHNIIAKDIQLICKKANVEYLSPHKLRHGHAVYALKRASNMAQLKAISQNIMHESVVTTDQIYGRLIDDDVQAIISGL